MTFRSLKSVAGFALALSAGFAHATPATDVTFDSLQESFGGTTALGSSYSEQGFEFSSANGLFAWGALFDADRTRMSGTLSESIGNNALTVTKSASGTFDLSSFDIADLANIGISSKPTMTYTDAAGVTHTETIAAIDKRSGLQTITVNLDDITSFSLRDSLGFQLDNVIMTANAPAVSAVPEPGSLALMVAGLGLIGFVAKRRKV